MVFLLRLGCTVMADWSVRIAVAACVCRRWSSLRLGKGAAAMEAIKNPAEAGFFYCLTASSDFDDLDLGLLRSVTEFGDLVERQVAIDIGSHAIDVLRVFHVLLDGR